MAKSDVLLLCVSFSILSLVGAFSEEEEDACEQWIPEPAYVHVNVSNPEMTRQFRIVDDLLVNRDIDEWKNVSEKYVVDALNGEVLSGFRMLGVSFRHLHSLRALLIAFICMILAEFLLFAVWKMGLVEFLYNVGLHSFFEKYRVAFTFLPVCCIIGLLSVNDHFKTAAQITLDGLAELETSQDKGFMPIKQRIQLNLDPLICKLRVINRQNYTIDAVSAESFLKNVVNGSWNEIEGLKDFRLPAANSEVCEAFQDDVVQKMRRINVGSLGNLVKLSREIKREYLENTASRMKKALSVLSEALGSIESFVERFHRDVVQLPCPVSTARFLYTVLCITVVSIVISGLFVIFAVMQVQFKKLASRFFSYFSIALLIFFSALLKLFFLFVLARTTFILLVQESSFEDDFKLLELAEPTEFADAGFNYSVNYGRLIKLSFLSSSTLFSIIRSHKEYDEVTVRRKIDAVKKTVRMSETRTSSQVPIALNGTRLWNPSNAYNRSLNEITKSAIEYPEVMKRVCEQITELHREVEEHSRKNACRNSSYLESAREIIREKKKKACEKAAFLESQSLQTADQIHSKSFLFWKRHLISEHEYEVIDRPIDSFSVMQIGLVFSDPAKKLRSKVLEPWFGMGLQMLAMAPFHFVLALYLMFVVPSMIMKKISADNEIEIQSDGESVTASDKSF